MNGKTSKLLRRFATQTKRRYRGLKRAWNRTPRWLRSEFRASIQHDLR